MQTSNFEAKKMADTEAMTKAIMQAGIEATETVVRAVPGTRAEAGTGPRSRASGIEAKIVDSY